MENGERVKLRQSVVFNISYLAARLGLPSDIMCNNQTYQLMLDRMTKAGIKTNTIIEDVGQLVREEAETIRVHREKRSAEEHLDRMSWDTYQRSVGRITSFICKTSWSYSVIHRHKNHTYVHVIVASLLKL